MCEMGFLILRFFISDMIWNSHKFLLYIITRVWCGLSPLSKITYYQYQGINAKSNMSNGIFYLWDFKWYAINQINFYRISLLYNIWCVLFQPSNITDYEARDTNRYYCDTGTSLQLRVGRENRCVSHSLIYVHPKSTTATTSTSDR